VKKLQFVLMPAAEGWIIKVTDLNDHIEGYVLSESLELALNAIAEINDDPSGYTDVDVN